MEFTLLDFGLAMLVSAILIVIERVHHGMSVGAIVFLTSANLLCWFFNRLVKKRNPELARKWWEQYKFSVVGWAFCAFVCLTFATCWWFWAGWDWYQAELFLCGFLFTWCAIRLPYWDQPERTAGAPLN
jgi:hypothetical protein